MNKIIQWFFTIFLMAVVFGFAWWLFHYVFWMLPLPSTLIIENLPGVYRDKGGDIAAPRPLTVEDVAEDSVAGELRPEEVWRLTNSQRNEHDLPSLSRSDLLDQLAGLKAEDMFQRQYFDHDSPDGEGVGFLAKQVGYAFIFISENLAKGNFESEQSLVDGWMNSPGHRQNILGQQYREIGLAVRRGEFEGNSIWLAVQVFGLPLSACPEPDSKLLEDVSINQNLLSKQYAELLVLRKDLRGSWPHRRDDHRLTVEEYNSLVEEYNRLAEETRAMIADYNRQLEEFNKCLKEYSEAYSTIFHSISDSLPTNSSHSPSSLMANHFCFVLLQTSGMFL